FQPLLYQVATASLNASDIAEPIRKVLQRQDNAEVLLAEVGAIDVEHRTVTFTDGGELGYDYLIVAAGAAHSYFGHDEWEPYAPSLKSIEDALDVRIGIRDSSIDDNGVDLDGSRMGARTVLWAAGVRASPIGESLGAPLDRTGRVLVRPDLSLPEHPEVFVVGDLAAMEQDGKPVPGVAQAAIQGGRHAASVIRGGLEGRPGDRE